MGCFQFPKLPIPKIIRSFDVILVDVFLYMDVSTERIMYDLSNTYVLRFYVFVLFKLALTWRSIPEIFSRDINATACLFSRWKSCIA